MGTVPISPADREADVVLRDGSTAHVRPVRHADADALRALYQGLSNQSRRLRFFTAAPNLDEVTRWAAQADGRDTAGGGGQGRGHLVGGSASPARDRAARWLPAVRSRRSSPAT